MAETPAAQEVRQRVEKGGVLSLKGVSAGGHAFLAVLLRRLFPERAVVAVLEGVKAQEVFHQDAETWLVMSQAGGRPAKPALFYPAWEVLPHEAKLPHADVISERLETLVELASPERDSAVLVVTNVTALLQKTFAPEALRKRMRTIKRGEQIDPIALMEWLEEQGYEPEAQVNHKGECALRGGILDVFPLNSPWPVRLEFFGDDLESLRYFDPVTQISREQIAEVTLPPGGEIGIIKRFLEKADALSPALSLGEKEAVAGTLIDHLPAGTIYLLCEPARLDQHARDYSAAIPEHDLFHVTWLDVLRQIESGATALHVSEADEAAESVELRLESLEAFRPVVERAPDPQVVETQRREFFGQLHRWLRQGYAVHVFCNNTGEQQRFSEIWQEYGLEQEGPRKRPTVHIGTLARGFLSAEAQLVVVTDAEIFGRYKVQRPRRLKSPHAQTSRSLLDIDFTDLEEGDYVVHLQHGIGRYLGLQMLPVAGGTKKLEKAVKPETQECLVVEYAPSDPNQPPPKLFVPVSEAHLISKYVGTGKARPALNSLGGTRWAKAKDQAERAVRDLAGELLSIQAARESQAGHAFSPDAPWQREFESAFVYEETPDQMRAILETKADLELPKPMDRLICGDVGYGKTEVAIRAAFKAVMGGKQVAILVPTTVLAQQHFNTFRERMADYPIRIELLSRFRSPQQQRKTIQQLAAGAVDIVIGTHRLVQNDVEFKDLGLVIIDEEQRFGVLHKEKFKLLRRLVDVLTLSATPIPRTLYLALTGARDMSTIETPPQDRLPVETIVTQYDERVIRDAIQRELNREGQVYYLHNRVFDISAVAERVKTLVPKARVLVGHGQMHSDELEEVMTRFVNGDADVLLSTTIIESGIDIPNANTIIIDRADRFGLSDLYQLRGRVGRYKHQAYAYLLLPRHAGLLTDARKRISAIKQYSSLGSGFKIAMRDLEIRGAGNLLGAQQSGHITAVGFDLYCQLLKQSISALKGEKLKPRVEVQVRLDFLALNATEESTPAAAKPRAAKRETSSAISVPRETAFYTDPPTELEEDEATVARTSAYIPLSYVGDSRQRVEIYRRIAELDEKAGVEKLRAEMMDRFGRLPESVDLLLQVAELKMLAASTGVTVIESRGPKAMLTRNNDYIMTGGKFPRLTKPDAKGRLKEIKKLLQGLR
ncbi:MAG: transcription-repair coupling factor [Verrucomicrobia subdivision 3 bacterium]|nr:transcription-repair coupling factor [Limisphaerales bacterium]